MLLQLLQMQMLGGKMQMLRGRMLALPSGKQMRKGWKHELKAQKQMLPPQ